MSSTVQSNDLAILKASRSLLQEFGEDFTIEQLKAKTKMSRATLYRRIGSKNRLLKKLAEERGEGYERIDIRSKILKATRIVLGREGLAAVSIEQIANEANVGVATVYRHFKDKSTLLKSFLEEMTPFIKVRELSLNPSEDLEADLRKIVEVSLGFFYENRDIFRLVLLGSEAEQRYLEGLRKRSDSSLGRLSSYFQSQIGAGRLKKVADTEDLALALMGMILAFAVIGPLHYNSIPENLSNSSKFIVDVFLNDLRAD